MKDITDKLHSMAQRLDAGKNFSNSEMQDLLLKAADAINGEAVSGETKSPQFTGFMIGDGDIAVQLDAYGDVDIIGCDEVCVTIHKDYVKSVIEALTNLRPMMGGPE